MAKFADRVRGFVRVTGERLRAAAKNIHTHGDRQMAVLEGVLAGVGIAGAAIVWVDDDAARAALRAADVDDGFRRWWESYRGDLTLIDGHARDRLIRDQPMPCLVLDTDAAESAQLLVTFDPIGDLAGFSRENFIALAGEFNSTSAAVQSFVAELASVEGLMRDGAGDLTPAQFGGDPLKPGGEAAPDGAGDIGGKTPEQREAEARQREEAKAALASALQQADDGPEVSATEELRAKWGTALGQLWVIPSLTRHGEEHRILCGDSTREADVARLMNGRAAALMQTDAPYGVDYVKVKAGIPVSGFDSIDKRFEDIANDDLKEEQLEDFLRAVMQRAHLTENAPVYHWHPSGPLSAYFFGAMKAEGYVVHRTIIWAKKAFVLTRSGMYHWQHEPCLYGWRQGHMPPWYGDKSQSTVWMGERDDDRNLHPTQKPLFLWLRPLLNHTQPGEIAYEPFSGSGGQILACEQLGRLCYAMELSPGYVAVALERASKRGMVPRLVA